MVYEECATSVYCVHKIACFRKAHTSRIYIQQYIYNLPENVGGSRFWVKVTLRKMQRLK